MSSYEGDHSATPNEGDYSTTPTKEIILQLRSVYVNWVISSYEIIFAVNDEIFVVRYDLQPSKDSVVCHI